MEIISDGWKEALLEAIENAPIQMSGYAYTAGYKDGLRKALDILNEHI